MKEYPNYRVAVEIILLRDNKVLLAKRADESVVGPGRWCVPAGKVKYDEIPAHGCIREAKEETQLDVEIIEEINVRAFKNVDSSGETSHRLVFTYLVKAKDETKEPIINEEHSEYCWISPGELNDERFSNMSDDLRKILKRVI
jgi:8-oxo-dGTP diphosphatase